MLEETIIKQKKDKSDLIVLCSRDQNGRYHNKDFYVKVLDVFGKIKTSGSNRLIWHFSNTNLGKKLADECFKQAFKRKYVYETKYKNEIERIAEKYYSLNK